MRLRSCVLALGALIFFAPITTAQEDDDLDAADPQVEYTYVFDTLVLNEWYFWDASYYGGLVYVFGEGMLRIYRDTSLNADFADEATFRDGELLLEAAVSDFELECREYPFEDSTPDCPRYAPPDQRGDLVFVGGSLFPRVSRAGVGYMGLNVGKFGGEEIPASLEALGYFASSITWIDLSIPTPTLPSSWGRVKAKYGNSRF